MLNHPGRRLSMMLGIALLTAATAGVEVGQAAAAKPHGAPSAASAKGLITGRLSIPGYSIVALGTNGKMTSSASGSFSLSPPAPQYTLQLITARGLYGGPVVVGGGGGKVVVGLRGPVRLGTIDIVASKGYAHLSTHLRAASVVASRWAWANHGVPIGNGKNFGLVKSPTKGSGPSGPGGDSDRSGIPNAFDIASNGNAIINALAPAGSIQHAAAAQYHRAIARASDNPPPPSGSGTGTQPPPNGQPPTNQPPPSGQPPANQPPPNGQPPANGSQPPGNGSQPPAGPIWMSQLFLPIEQTVNEDASGVTQDEIDSTLQANLNLKLLSIPSQASQLELNCNGLSFCSQGGTGKAAQEGLLPGSGGSFSTLAFPGAMLDAATGFGELVGPNAPSGLLGSTSTGSKEFSLYPNATTGQIGSGDVVTAVGTIGGATSNLPTTINFVFTTVPAISAYSDTAGDSGTISYPDKSQLGTRQNPIEVKAGSGGDVVVKFTLFRPQRAGVSGAGESSYMDIGHLWYALDSASAPSPNQTTIGSATSPQCPASSYSEPSSTLSVVTGGGNQPAAGGTQFSAPPGDGMVVDSAADQPASPSNTISFSVDLTACTASKNQSLPVGQPVMFDISANSQSSTDHTNQTFWVERTA